MKRKIYQICLLLALIFITSNVKVMTSHAEEPETNETQIVREASEEETLGAGRGSYTENTDIEVDVHVHGKMVVGEKARWDITITNNENYDVRLIGTLPNDWTTETDKYINNLYWNVYTDRGEESLVGFMGQDGGVSWELFKEDGTQMDHDDEIVIRAGDSFSCYVEAMIFESDFFNYDEVLYGDAWGDAWNEGSWVPWYSCGFVIFRLKAPDSYGSIATWDGHTIVIQEEEVNYFADYVAYKIHGVTDGDTAFLKITPENLIQIRDDILKNNYDACIVPRIVNINETELEQSALDKIQSVADDMNIAMYLDFSIDVYEYENYDRNNLQKLGTHTRIGENVSLTMDIPKEYRKIGRDFSVIRFHDGVAEKLSDIDSDPNTITFQTDKFSVYALAYADTLDVFAENEGNEFYKDVDGNVRCIDSNGNPIINEFKCDGTYTYYFQLDGTAMRNRLTYHPDGMHVIYFDEDGHEVFSNFHHVEKSIAGDTVDDLCFFDVYGYMYVDVMTYDQAGEKLYYVNPYGVIEQGRWFEFSETGVWAGTTNKIGKGYGYANADGTLMINTHTYDWLGRFVYLQGDGHMQ